MDATYDEDADSDDSITLVKTVQKAQQKDKSESKTTKQKQKRQSRRKSKKKNDDQEIIKCTETCHCDSSSDSIRCNLCMDWFHATCVEIHNIDTIGAWVVVHVKRYHIRCPLYNFSLKTCFLLLQQ